MKIGIKGIPILALSVLLSNTALAADPPELVFPTGSWTGPYVGGFIGAGGIVNNIEIGAGNFNGVGGEGFLGGIFVGYNYQFDNDIVIGIQGELGVTDLTTDLVIPGFVILDAQPQWTVAISGRLGWLASPTTLLYLIGGYSYADYDVDINFLGAPFNFNQDYNGFHVGTGIETHVSRRVTARVEYRYTQYSGENWGVGGLNVEPSSHTGILGLAYNFHDAGEVSGAFSIGGVPVWSGFYIGLQAGAGAIVNNIELPGAGPGNFNGIGGEGVLGGVLAGYNHQFGTNWVAGIQADIAATDLTTDLVFPGFNADMQPEWTGSISGRIGWLPVPETMLYAIGGYTHADYQLDGVAGRTAFSASQDYDGFHVGTGIETFVHENMTWRAEYRYTQYSGEDWGTGGFLNVEPSSHTGTVAAVWKFGSHGN